MDQQYLANHIPEKQFRKKSKSWVNYNDTLMTLYRTNIWMNFVIFIGFHIKKKILLGDLDVFDDVM